MKKMLLAAFAGATAIVLAGCVGTVNGGHTFATSLNSDSVSGRYQRPLSEVYNASVAVVKNNGVLLAEYVPHDTTNAVRSLYGKVSNEKVWVRVEAVTPSVTQVDVQARSSMGLTDMELVHELEKEIAIRLATTP